MTNIPMTKIVKASGWVVVLAVASLSAWAQRPGERRGGGRDRDDSDVPCHCHGHGIDCLFGYASECHITCGPGRCQCVGGVCFLGFPVAPVCTCT